MLRRQEAVQSPLLRTVLCDGTDTNTKRAGRAGSHTSEAEWQTKKSSRIHVNPPSVPADLDPSNPRLLSQNSTWCQLVTIIHDEKATHIQLDVVAFLLSQTNRKEHGGTQTTTRGTELDPQR